MRHSLETINGHTLKRYASAYLFYPEATFEIRKVRGGKFYHIIAHCQGWTGERFLYNGEDHEVLQEDFCGLVHAMNRQWRAETGPVKAQLVGDKIHWLNQPERKRREAGKFRVTHFDVGEVA